MKYVVHDRIENPATYTKRRGLNLLKKYAIALFTSLLITTPALYGAGVSDTTIDISRTVTSWITLGIILSSFLCAWALNYSAPKVRVFGTLLASLGCFTIAGWFIFYVLGTGFLENPKPNQTPLDSAKPTLLWMQFILALIAGFILLAVAYAQRKNNETLELTAKNETHRYGRVSRLLHWTIAFLFIILIPMGIFSSIIPEDVAYRRQYYIAHKTIGVVVLILIVIRLFWNRRSKRPALDASLKPVERKLAHVVHITLYVMMVAIPLTGFIMTSFHGYPTFFFVWELQPLWEQSKTGTLAFGVLHKYLLPYLLYIILGAHVLGALKHHFIDKHKAAFKRMVS